MIIDFHTHIFPDKIARRTIEHLSGKGGIPAYSTGEVSGLLERMNEAGVDIAVTLPVVTAPHQFDSITKFACEINERYRSRLISFAGIHPACEDIKGKMRLIKELGFLGVKLHPDYQGTFIDDEGYIEIIKEAERLDLIAVTHSGVDVGFPDEEVKCTPRRILRLLERVRHPKLVLAHLGANEMVEEVLDTIAGEDLYLDTAYVLRATSKELFTKLVEKHSADKILFASDSPWSSIKGDVEILRSYGLSREVEEKIFSKNAKRLLKIQ
ncbi:MAG: amidohydrolase family protein [Clostridia bacterium]|nr:amidohydrolase family protein [Clostridia bacterium]MBQ8290218.1 amidohydrolase family protein [Clostridia bacterium]